MKWTLIEREFQNFRFEVSAFTFICFIIFQITIYQIESRSSGTQFLSIIYKIKIIGNNLTDYHSPNASKISLLALSTAEVSSVERYISVVFSES